MVLGIFDPDVLIDQSFVSCRHLLQTILQFEGGCQFVENIILVQQ
jgi:hypothetical protein